MKVLFKFVFFLDNYDIRFRLNGPLFHRWLPDGEKDAITLDTRVPDTLLRVWFKRWGFVSDEGRIEFKLKEEKVDPKVMSKQGVLEAGPLLGNLEMEISDGDEFRALKNNDYKNQVFMNIGKKIIKAIDDPVIDFIHILRVPFGQYWVIEPSKWDSQEESIGQYCSSHQIGLSLDEGKSWTDFRPADEAVPITIVMTLGSYEHNISEPDWKKIAELTKKEVDRSLSLTTLVQAHHYRDQGDYKHAVLESVTSLELAVSEYLNKRLKRLNLSLNDIGDVADEKLPIKVKLVSFSFDKISELDLKNTLKIIKIRNNIIHEGLMPADREVEKNLPGLFNFILNVTGHDWFKFPEARTIGPIYDDNKWQEYYALKKSS